MLVGHFVTSWTIYNDHGLFAKIVINLNDQNKWEASSIQSNIEKSNEILASGILCWYRSKFVPSIIFDSIYMTDLLALCDTLSRWRMHSMTSILKKQKKFNFHRGSVGYYENSTNGKIRTEFCLSSNLPTYCVHSSRVYATLNQFVCNQMKINGIVSRSQSFASANRKWFDTKNQINFEIERVLSTHTRSDAGHWREGFKANFQFHSSKWPVGDMGSIVVPNKSITNATYGRPKVWLMCTAQGKCILYYKTKLEDFEVLN